MVKLWGKPVAKESGLHELSDLLTELQEEPTLQVAVIENSIDKIASSYDSGLLERVVRILAKNNAYRGLHILFTYSVVVDTTPTVRFKPQLELFKVNLTPEQKISFADYLVSLNDGKMLLEALSLLDGLNGVQDRIRSIVTNPKFYERYPVSAVRAAIKAEDYEAVGVTFAHLRKANAYEHSSREDTEIRELRQSLIPQDLIQDRLIEIMSEVRQHVQSRGRVVLAHYSSPQQKVYTGLNDLLASMREPKRAFEAVGDAFLARIQREGSAASDDIYGLTIEYFVLSGNTGKLLQAAKMANQVKDLPRGYSTSIAAFRGFKALLTLFNIDDAIRQEVLAELKETFKPFWIYAHWPQAAIETTEVAGDLIPLRDNFYQSFEKQIAVNGKVYAALKRHNAVDDAKIIGIAEEYLKTHPIRWGSEGELERVLKFAELVKDKNIDPALVISAIAQAGLKSGDAEAGFKYLHQRGLLNPPQLRLYALVDQRKI